MNELLKAADLLRRCCKDGRYDAAIRVLTAATEIDKGAIVGTLGRGVIPIALVELLASIPETK